ncbi:MAG: nucleotidyltransferase family protein [Armatimonadetes bacterium]|nr:nucleotidyltransferase family protein [Armatimonadota bacterium]
MEVNAVILAGAPADPEMCPGENTISRAMLRIGPKTMLQWVVDALISAESIDRIIAVGDVAADSLDATVIPGSSFLENLMLGVEASGSDERVLVLSSDIPLIGPQAVDDFVTRALDSGAEMCYPIIRAEDCLAKYPALKRTFLRTSEGSWTGGNMLLVSPTFLRRNRERISQAYAARKKPLALAAMLGPGVLVRAVAAQLFWPALLPISRLEQVASKLVGGHVVAVVTHYPEIGEDVDKLADLEAVRRELGGS